MKLRLAIAALLLLLPLSAAASPEAVERAFQDYKAAILGSDGTTASELVTQASRDLYRRYADEALTLDRPELGRLHVADRITVMMLRHSLGRTDLENMSGGEIVAYAVNHGWIGKEGAANLRLGNYEVDGDYAAGTVLGPDGQPSPFKMQFQREEGAWRLDLVEMLNMSRMVIGYSIEQTGLSEDDFIMLMLEFSSGRKPGPEIWSPPT